MRSLLASATLMSAITFGLAGPADAADCSPDAVRSGTVCMDKYEASLWYVSPDENRLVRKIQDGRATLEDLADGGAIQLGLTSGDLAANGCPISANGCVNVYAVSIAGVTPSRWVNWFQAVAIARNSHKRLPTNQEWQAAALGSPDAFPCNIDLGIGLRDTGAEPGCVSDVGAVDMPGNSGELVADWGELSDGCTNWGPDFSSDLSCVGGPGPNPRLPGAFLRSGFWAVGTGGVFTIRSSFDPGVAAVSWGFRCAR